MLRKGYFPIESLMFGLFNNNKNSIEDEVKLSPKQVKKSQNKKNKKEKQKQRIETYKIHLPAEVLFSGNFYTSYILYFLRFNSYQFDMIRSDGLNII